MSMDRILRGVRRRVMALVGGSEVASMPDRSAVRRLQEAVAADGRAAGRTFGPSELDALAGTARRLHHEAELTRAIGRGEDLAGAVATAVRGLTAAGDWDEWNVAWSLVEGVERLEQAATATAIGRALLFHARRQYERAWRAARVVDDETLARCLPTEAIDMALAAAEGNDAGAAERARTIARTARAASPVLAVEIAARLAAVGDATWHELADSLPAEPSAAAFSPAQLRLHRWLLTLRAPAADGGSSTATTTAGDPGAVTIGLLVTQAPLPPRVADDAWDDDVETLALLAALARVACQQDVSLEGDVGFAALAGELAAAQDGTPSSRRAVSAQGQGAGRKSVKLVAIDRATARVTQVPEGTWVLAAGDLGEMAYGIRRTLPMHGSTRPLYLSLHLADVDALDQATIEQLRAVGPVGCRDWTTVFVLLGAGVDAFFAGGLATTLDALYPGRAIRPAGGAPTGLRDAPRRAAGTRGAVELPTPPETDLAAPAPVRLRGAWERLTALRSGYGRLITGRLHLALAAASAGVPTEFAATPRGEGRWAGLTEAIAREDVRVAMAARLRGLVETATDAIARGGTTADVHAAWREHTLPLVAEARERYQRPPAARDTGLDVTELVATTVPGRRSFGPPRPADTPDRPVTDIVIAFDQNLVWPAAVLLESVVAGATRPVAIWILARGIGSAYQEWLGRAFPETPITFIPCDRIAYDVGGPKRRIPRRITVSTMDRLLAADILPQLTRVVYLDIDMLAMGDVTELGTMDLEGKPLAARDSNVSEVSEWHRAGRGLTETEALELRRSMALLHGVGHRALNAGLLVMDLERMRRDGFITRLLGFGERFGLHDQDTALAYVGPDRVHLGDGWNAMPVLEDVEEPRLVHWASFPKPWDAPLTYQRQAWQAHAARLAGRAGSPPAG